MVAYIIKKVNHLNMEFINTELGPKPGGHYTQAIKSGHLLFLSGQLPINAQGLKVTGDIRQQVRQVLENLIAITTAAGGNKNSIIKTTVYITKIEYWPMVNEVYQEVFGNHRPARAIVPVPELHYGFEVEIEGISELTS